MKAFSMKKVIASSLAKNVAKKNIDDNLDIQEYTHFLFKIKKFIKQAQTKALLSVNHELLKMYWNIGKIISIQQKKNGWGSQTIDKLATDIQILFPGLAGFSRSNIFRMQAFYGSYEIVAQAVRQLEQLPIFSIPWGHNVTLLQKLKSNTDRLWYAQQTIEQGWSRTVLEWHISLKSHDRQGKAITNFKKQIAAPESELVQQAFKDPYILDFITLREPYFERDIEKNLMANIQKVMLEFGKGFAFAGQQYHIKVGSQDFYIDLLFYHVPLKRYVVIELKARDFNYLDAGQISFYITAVDEQLKGVDDNPTIGLILCKDKDHYVAEYALKNINIPIGVASYEINLIKELPIEFQDSLPSIKEIEAKLEIQTAMQTIESKEIIKKTTKKSVSKKN